MGASNSKAPLQKTQSIRKSKRDNNELGKIEADIDRIKRDIENSQQVNIELLRSQLLLNAGKVQDIRNNDKKKKKKDVEYMKILNVINSCIILLEEKEKERDDGRESNLDLGAVESHSFISQDVSRVLERKEREETRIKSLTQISTRINELDSEIRASVAHDDIRSLIIVEKKLHLLYNDLEQINPRPMTSDFQEKERLAALLIKFNKKINNVKRKSGVPDGSDGLIFSKPPTTGSNDVLEVIQIIDELSDLEVSAFTFENVKSSNEYVKLENKLKKHYTTLENMVTNNEDERRRILTAKNLTKKILASLKQKANENETLLTRQLTEIDNIIEDIASYRTQAEYLSSADSTNFLQLDQKIRLAWDKLNLINTKFPQLRQKKEKTIVDIQDLLHRMNDRSSEFNRRESRRKQLKELKSTFVSLKRSETIKQDEESRALLEEIEMGLRKFLSEKRPELARQKNYSVSSEVMDQLVTEITTEKMFKGEPVEDLRQIEDAKIVPVVDMGTEIMEKIQHIDKNINDIRNSIRSFKGTTDSEMYDGIEEQLLRHKNELETIDSTSRLICNAKERTLKKIDDTNITLRKKTEDNEVKEMIRRSSINPNRRSVKSVNGTLQNIMAIDSNVHSIEKKVRKFNGNTNDKEYASLVEELHRNDQALREIEVGSYDSLMLSKQEVLNHINKLQTEIATKASENEHYEQDELLKIKQVLSELKQMKKKIDCFSGTFKNIQYNQLETDLRNILDRALSINEVSAKIAKAKNQTKETIEKYLRVLEERSAKPQTTNSLASLERAGVNLLDIKNRMEYFAGTIHDDQYFQIIRDLHVCNDEIKTLTDEGEPGVRKMQYLQYIQDLFNYFDAKMNNRSQQQEEIYANVNDIKVQEVLQKFEGYSKEADDIKKEVDSYTPNSPASHYHALDQKLIDLMVKVDKLQVYQVTEIKNKRIEIQQKLNKCSEMLDEKCRPMVDSSAAPDRDKILSEIDSVMEEVDMLNDSIRNFQGGKHDQHYINLDESLIRLFLKLDSINPSSDAIAKNNKLKALKVVKMNMKLLDEKVKHFEELQYEGETLV